MFSLGMVSGTHQANPPHCMLSLSLSHSLRVLTSVLPVLRFECSNPFLAKAFVPLVKIAPKNSFSEKFCWPEVFVSKTLLQFGVHEKWALKQEVIRRPTGMQEPFYARTSSDVIIQYCLYDHVKSELKQSSFILFCACVCTYICMCACVH